MRLIDADELKKKIRRCDDSATRATFDYVDEDDIDDAPTVDVLEQIRAEIKDEMDDIASGCLVMNSNDGGYYSGLWWALKIIDKYR